MIFIICREERMDRPLTVDELIKKLQEHSERGLGGASVIAVPSGAPVESVHGPVTYTNAEGHAVMLYARGSEPSVADGGSKSSGDGKADAPAG